MSRLVEHDSLVVVTEIGGGADQPGGQGVEGDQVAVDRDRLGHGLGKEPRPGIVGQDDLCARALQEG